MSDDSRRGAPEPWHERPAYDGPHVARSGGSLWRVLPWLFGGLVILLLAVLAGFGAAYLIATSNAVPPPTVAPSPTPVATPGLTEAPTPSPDTSPTVRPPSRTATPDPAPEATPLVHVVQRGESISIIAAQYGVTIEEIIELNELENPNLIVPGQELLIPAPSD